MDISDKTKQMPNYLEQLPKDIYQHIYEICNSTEILFEYEISHRNNGVYDKFVKWNLKIKIENIEVDFPGEWKYGGGFERPPANSIQSFLDGEIDHVWIDSRYTWQFILITKRENNFKIERTCNSFTSDILITSSITIPRDRIIDSKLNSVLQQMLEVSTKYNNYLKSLQIYQPNM